MEMDLNKITSGFLRQMFLLDDGGATSWSAGTEQSGAEWRVAGMRIICYLFVVGGKLLFR